MILPLTQLITNFRFADFLDIIIVAFFLYFILLWLKRKASRSVVIGIITVITLYGLARFLNMYMTSQVFQAGLTAALVGLVIIFQDDIRMIIERISNSGLLHSKHRLVASNKTVDCLVESLVNLARDRIGALIVIKGRESIDRHLSGGISVNGRISTPLLYSIFHPETPSHDGAVIIEGERIEKFGVRLPLSHNLSEVGERGTRHTAGLGLSERSDALVLIVSEERGTISIANDGHLTTVDKEKLRLSIDNFYKNVFPTPSEQVNVSRLTQHAGIKLTAFLSAIALWLLFAHRVDMVSRTFTVPVEYRNVPANWVIEDTRPSEIRVSLSGPERSFNFDVQSLVASFDVDHLREGSQSLPITKLILNTPSGIEVNQISPKSLTFRASQIEETEIPVRVKTIGRLSAKYDLVEIKSQPNYIRIQIPVSHRGVYSEVTTEPVDLEKIVESGFIKTRIQLPSGVQLSDASQGFVKIAITISKKRR